MGPSTLKQQYPKLYNTWRGMRARCNNPNNFDYKWYGGKGVKCIEEWKSFKVFKDWALLNGYEDGLTVDRKDSRKDYTPDNIRFITHEENVIRANTIRYKKRKLAGMTALSIGVTIQEVINIFKVCERTVYHWKAEMKKER